MTVERPTESPERQFVSAKAAADRVGYTADYVSRLAREGKVIGQRHGRSWFVELDSVKLFAIEMEAQQRERQEEIRQERRTELAHRQAKQQASRIESSVTLISSVALAQTSVVLLLFALTLSLVWNTYDAKIDLPAFSLGVASITESLVRGVGWQTVTQNVATENDAAFSNLDILSPSPDPVVMPTTEVPLPPTPTNLLLLPPSTTPTQATAIADSFSDEVTVEYDGDRTGIITPQFKHQSEESYRFLLVPVNPSQR